MTINGTDYRILQKGAARKGNAFGSFKYAGKSALRYELGVDILARNLIWVSGPYPAGKYTDIAIFNSVLANCLEPGLNTPDITTLPGAVLSPSHRDTEKGRGEEIQAEGYPWQVSECSQGVENDIGS